LGYSRVFALHRQIFHTPNKQVGCVFDNAVVYALAAVGCVCL